MNKKTEDWPQRDLHIEALAALEQARGRYPSERR
jgi:hypothetical protein